MSTRRLTLIKRVSLADLAEGWDECFALVRAATYKESIEFQKLSKELLKKSNELKMEAIFKLVEDHFVSGKVKAEVEGESAKLVDMLKSDIRDSATLTNKLFNEIMGIKLDPKDSQPTAPSAAPPKP